MEGESIIGYQFSIIGDELMVMIYRLSVIRHFVSGIRHPASFLSTVSCYGLSNTSYRHFVSGILHPFLSTVICLQLLLNFLSSPGQ